MNAELIILEAKKEIGYKEMPAGSNKTKFGEWFGLNGVPWCGIFVSYIFFKSGFQLPKIGYSKGYAGCQTAIEHFKGTGEVVSKEDVQPGDIVFYDFNKDKKYDHTGIFFKNNGDDTFQAIEGNTAVGNNSNGGEVMDRKRNFDDVEIFVRPSIFANMH